MSATAERSSQRQWRRRAGWPWSASARAAASCASLREPARFGRETCAGTAVEEDGGVERALVAYGVQQFRHGRPRGAHTVVVANSGTYGHGLRIVPSAEPDDGLLDVLVVGDGPRRHVVTFMEQAKKGTHTARPEVTLRTGISATVDADRPLPVCADGDEVAHLPARISLLPGALKLLA